MVITHYYVKGSKPFRSIAQLDFAAAEELRASLRESGLPIFARFKWEDYLAERTKTESWLKNEFVRAGSSPEMQSPLYFVLGTSGYLVERYKGKAVRIAISLDGIAPGHISFTFPDSMASRLIAESRDPVDYDPNVHGQLFLMHDIKT